MDDAARITIEEAFLHFEQGTALFVDIRDPESIASSRIPDSSVLNNENLDTFLADTPKSQSLIVYCYHGNNSKMAASYLLEQGFSQVWSMDGGFEEWRHKHPVSS